MREVNENGSFVERNGKGKSGGLEEKPVAVALCPPQTAHTLNGLKLNSRLRGEKTITNCLTRDTASKYPILVKVTNKKFEISPFRIDMTLHAFCYICIYRVIHKSLRDFRPLRYSSRDGRAEGEHVNRGRDIPSFCPTLQVLDMSTLLCLSCLLRGRVRKFRRDL